MACAKAFDHPYKIGWCLIIVIIVMDLLPSSIKMFFEMSKILSRCPLTTICQIKKFFLMIRSSPKGLYFHQKFYDSLADR